MKKSKKSVCFQNLSYKIGQIRHILAQIHICIFNSCLKSGINYFLIALFSIHEQEKKVHKGYKGVYKTKLLVKL